MSEPRQKPRCAARRVNSRAPDFECKLDESGHNVHVDPRTGQRWGDGGPPHGMRRKYAKKYGNPKLHRQSLLMGRAKATNQKRAAL